MKPIIKTMICLSMIWGGVTGCAGIDVPQPLNPLTTKVISSTPVLDSNFYIVRDTLEGRNYAFLEGNKTVYPLVSSAPVLTQSLDIAGYTYLLIQGPTSNCQTRAEIFAIRQGGARLESANALMPDCGVAQIGAAADGQTALFYENGNTEAPRLAWNPQQWSGTGIRIFSSAEGAAFSQRQSGRRMMARRSFIPAGNTVRYGHLSAVSANQDAVQRETGRSEGQAHLNLGHD